MKAERTRVLAALVLVAVAICAVAVVASPASADDAEEGDPWGEGATEISDSTLSSLEDEDGAITLESGEYYIASGSSITIDGDFTLGEDATLYIADGGLLFLDRYTLAGDGVKTIAGTLEVYGDLVIGSFGMIVEDSAKLVFHAGSTAAIQFGNSDPDYIIADQNMQSTSDSTYPYSPTGIILTEGTLTCEGFSLDVPGIISYVLNWMQNADENGEILGSWSYDESNNYELTWTFDDDDVDKALAYIEDVLDDAFDGATITLDGEASVNDINMIQSISVSEVQTAVDDVEISLWGTYTIKVASGITEDLEIDIDWLRSGSTVVVTEGSVLKLGDGVGSRDDHFNFLGTVDNNGTIEINGVYLQDDQEAPVIYTGTIDNEDGVVYINSGTVTIDGKEANSIDVSGLTIVGGEVYVSSIDDIPNVVEGTEVILDYGTYTVTYDIFNLETVQGYEFTFGIPQIQYAEGMGNIAGQTVNVIALKATTSDGVELEINQGATSAYSEYNRIYETEEEADANRGAGYYGVVDGAGVCYVNIGMSVYIENYGAIPVYGTVELTIHPIIISVTIAGPDGPDSEIPDQMWTGSEVEIDYGYVVDEDGTLVINEDGDYYLYDEDGNILDYKFGEDFELEYEDNVDVGTATVTVVWIGNYATEDDVTGEFEIVPAVASITVTTTQDVHVGQALDETLLTVTGTYDNEDTGELTGWTETVVSAMKEAGYLDENGVVIVSDFDRIVIDVDDEQILCQFGIEIQEVGSIEVVDGTYVDEYEFGDELDTTGMVIVVAYEDGCYAVFCDEDGEGFELFTDAGDAGNYLDQENVGTTQSGSYYEFIGTIVVDGATNTVTGYYTLEEASNSTGGTNNVVGDLARYLGALYRGSDSIASITYEDVVYTWNTTDYTELRGSNWRDADGNTLVSVITADVRAEMAESESALAVDDSYDVEITVAYENGYSYDLTLVMTIVADEWDSTSVESDFKALTTGFDDSGIYFEFDPEVFDSVAGETEVGVTFVLDEPVGHFTVTIGDYVAYYIYDYDFDGVYELYAIQLGEGGKTASVYGFSDTNLVPEGYEFAYWMLYSGVPEEVEGEDEEDLYSLPAVYTGTDYLPGATYEMGGDPNVWKTGIVTFVAVFVAAEGGDEEGGEDVEAELAQYLVVCGDEYEVDDEFDFTVYAIYDNGSVVDVTADATYAIYDNGVALEWTVFTEAGNYTVYVYVGDETVETVYVTVSEAETVVPAVTEIIVYGETEYVIGDVLDITVVAVYSDGTTEELEAGEYTVSGFDSETAGEYTVTVSYSETVSATIDVTVSVASTGGDETEEPAVESENIHVSLEATADGVTVYLFSMDDGYIPTGTVTVTYNYTYYIDFNGVQIPASGSGSITLEIGEDLAGSKIVEISATFSDAEHFSDITSVDGSFNGFTAQRIVYDSSE